MALEDVKKYYQFSLTEKIGVTTILFITAISFAAGVFFEPHTNTPLNFSKIDSASLALQEQLYDSSNNTKNEYKTYTKYNQNKPFTGTMFYFDPNSITQNEWLQLGVSEKTSTTILHYISKGGRFKEPEDLNKIWGLSDADKQRLIPYANIKQVEYTNKYVNNYTPYTKKIYEKKVVSIIDVNFADSSGFDALPGIGGGYSRRIVNFRNKLGGFYSINQIAETFGLPDSVFQKIKPYLQISNNIKKISINTCTEEELKTHPYIRWQLAKVIMAYKREHGNFTSVQDLKKVMLITDDIYSKISPYLSL